MGSTKDVSKVYVEESTVSCEHEVVQMAIPHTQDVGHHAVARTALQVGLVYFRLDPKRCCMVYRQVSPSL